MIAIVCAKYAIPGIPNLLKIEPRYYAKTSSTFYLFCGFISDVEATEIHKFFLVNPTKKKVPIEGQKSSICSMVMPLCCLSTINDVTSGQAMP